MKVCPNCAFTNEERYPTCLLCHTVLADVPSTPSADPDHPEHEQRALLQKRWKLVRRQLFSAGFFYALTITVSALIGGQVTDPLVLLLYFASGVFVALCVTRGGLGRLSAGAVQGALSVLLLLTFGPLQLFIFFMLAAHASVPALFCLWVEMIHSAHR